MLRQECSPHWRWWVALHGILTGGVVLLASNASPRLLQVIREIYPLPLFLLFYRESQMLNRGLFPEPFAPLFFRIEQSLFGFQPSIAFSQTLPQTAFAELVYAGYFSFYLMNIGAVVGWVLRDPGKASRFLSTVAVHALVLGIHNPGDATHRNPTAFRDPQSAPSVGPERVLFAQDGHDLVPERKDTGGFGPRKRNHDLPEPTQLGAGFSKRHQTQGG